MLEWWILSPFLLLVDLCKQVQRIWWYMYTMSLGLSWFWKNILNGSLHALQTFDAGYHMTVRRNYSCMWVTMQIQHFKKPVGFWLDWTAINRKLEREVKCVCWGGLEQSYCHVSTWMSQTTLHHHVVVDSPPPPPNPYKLLEKILRSEGPKIREDLSSRPILPPHPHLGSLDLPLSCVPCLGRTCQSMANKHVASIIIISFSWLLCPEQFLGLNNVHKVELKYCTLLYLHSWVSPCPWHFMTFGTSLCLVTSKQSRLSIFNSLSSFNDQN